MGILLHLWKSLTFLTSNATSFINFPCELPAVFLIAGKWKHNVFFVFFIKQQCSSCSHLHQRPSQLNDLLSLISSLYITVKFDNNKIILFRFYRYVEPQNKTSKPNSLCGSSSAAAAPKPSIYTRNPIITVTEHTPTPSPDYLRRQGSIDSQLDVLSQMGCYGKVHMLRSHTDSHIAYTGADEIEAPGSSFYITPEGGIDLEVLLLVS